MRGPRNRIVGPTEVPVTPARLSRSVIELPQEVSDGPLASRYGMADTPPGPALDSIFAAALRKLDTLAAFCDPDIAWAPSDGEGSNGAFLTEAMQQMAGVGSDGPRADDDRAPVALSRAELKFALARIASTLHEAWKAGRRVEIVTIDTTLTLALAAAKHAVLWRWGREIGIGQASIAGAASGGDKRTAAVRKSDDAIYQAIANVLAEEPTLTIKSAILREMIDRGLTSEGDLDRLARGFHRWRGRQSADTGGTVR